MCELCDDTGWVCSRHKENPWAGGSDADTSCDHGGGVPCSCNPDATHERIAASVICGEFPAAAPVPVQTEK
jgi:hypothetical protein